MRSLWAAAGMVLLTVGANAQTAEQLYGTWRVNRVVNASPVVALSGGAASRLVGQILTLKPNQLQFARQTCQPSYRKSAESLAQITEDYELDAKSLDLPDPVSSFDGQCVQIFPRTQERILFTWKGYFLEAVRSKAARTRR